MRERVSLDLRIATADWLPEKQCLIKKSKDHQDINLYLKSVAKQIIDIEIIYRLSNGYLTPRIVREELKSGIPSADFIAFYIKSLGERSESINSGSYDLSHSIYKKLKDWRKQILFTEIDFQFFEDFKAHCRSIGNGPTTINGNIKTIKTVLNKAIKLGLKLRINLCDIKVGSTRGNRTSLSSGELKKVFNYYYEDTISNHDRLVCGYFLFSCMTGLRISDVQKTRRTNLTEDYVSFISKKTKKDQSIVLNNTAKKLVEHNPELFLRKISDQKINSSLKRIMAKLEIDKKVSFHVGRHTFATTFLRAGGSVEKLQLLLGHSDIKETMIYVHIVSSEANKDIYLLDEYLN